MRVIVVGTGVYLTVATDTAYFDSLGGTIQWWAGAVPWSHAGAVPCPDGAFTSALALQLLTVLEVAVPAAYNSFYPPYYSMLKAIQESLIAEYLC